MSSKPLFVDSHVHLYEYGDNWKRFCLEDYVLLAVSDDYESSIKTVEIAKSCRGVVAAVGIHPWNVKNYNIEVSVFEDLVKRCGIRFLGEIGIDKKFVPETFEYQKRVFEEFLDIAERYKLGLSIHAPNAWREALDLVKNRGIAVAIFHWYTGPEDIAREIVDYGFYIGINVAAQIQKKHREIIKVVPLENMLTESDAPYKYRGLYLEPTQIPHLINIVAEIKGVDSGYVKEVIWRNFLDVAKKVGISLP